MTDMKNLISTLPHSGLKTSLSIIFFSSLLTVTCAKADTTNFIETVYHDWSAPRATEFARDSAALVPAVQALCEASPATAKAAMQEARNQWRSTLSSWERLSGVAFGPVLERHTQRQIDFTPTRPHLIEKAIKSAPATPADMELVGSPAKGLPTLEWLLWVKPVKPATPECSYAVQVAADIQRESDALATTLPIATDAHTALSELVNQWVGGIERLLWANMELPIQAAKTSGKKASPDFPRHASGAASVSWTAEWDALRNLATEGEGSLAGALRARNQNQLADTLIQTVKQTDTSMRNLRVTDHAKILAASSKLAELKSLVESEVASALEVNIGFSDADGD